MTALTEDSLAEVIMRKRWTDSFCLPRYTPGSWWECDVFQMTDAHWWTEYEVKLTVSDFRADAKKEHEVGPYEYGVKRPMAKKHDLLAAHSPEGPNRFYYVTPQGLLDKETLPPWAGWIEVYEAEYDWGGPVRVCLHEKTRVKAPILHRKKRKEDPNHVRGTCYWRYHRLRTARGASPASESTDSAAKLAEKG